MTLLGLRVSCERIGLRSNSREILVCSRRISVAVENCQLVAWNVLAVAFTINLSSGFEAREKLPLGRVSLTGQEARSWRAALDFRLDDGRNGCLREQGISITTNGPLMSVQGPTLCQHKFECPQVIAFATMSPDDAIWWQHAIDVFASSFSTYCSLLYCNVYCSKQLSFKIKYRKYYKSYVKKII